MVKLPKWIYNKWQEITDLLAKLIEIPAALIMYTENEYMEVFVSSNTKDNPYEVGDKEKWYGLYCETVIKTQKELLIPNALKDINWDKNPDIKLGMISYLGYPINYPDQKPFGTICVLDNKENGYSDEYRSLLQHFKILIENDLFNLHELKTKEEKLNLLLVKQNKELQVLKEKAEEREELLKKIAENFPNSYISIIEKDYSVGFTSGQEFVKQNLNPNDFVGLKLEQVFGKHTDYIKEKYQKTFNGEETRFELFINNQYQLYKTVPLYNEKGKITRILSVVENITEQKNKEIELQLAKEKAEESNQLKTEFLHNLSHEIRTPMNGIIGFSEMLSNKDISQKRREYYTTIIQSSSRQLLKIIDDILEISTLETKQVTIKNEIVCMNHLILELFSFFNLKAVNKNIPIYIKKGLPDHQSTIMADKTKLIKILSNLIDNALKFTNEGFIEIGYNLVDNFLKIYVKDTGIGISPKNKKIIFERFSQEEKEISTKYGGLGLGLSISKENAQLLGGDISLVSEKGKGSTFYFTIPYTPFEPIKENIKNIKNKKITTGKKKSAKILIAEDEEINFLFLEAALEEMEGRDFTILHAKNGKEAIEMLKTNDIDIVLMDIKMPIMNGHEATHKIKSLHPNLPIIAQTAYSTESEKELTLNQGCDDFVSKPINKEKLFELINKYVINE